MTADRMRAHFHVVDYVLFAASVAVSLGIGVYFSFAGRRPTTNKQFLTADGKMKILPVAISLVVSFISTINILGNPAEVYAYGTQYMWYLMATVIGIICSTMLFVPLYYPLRITSIYEYTRMRFKSKWLEGICVLLALMNGILFSGVLIYSPCLAFQEVSGFPAWISIIICGLTATIYTSLGGMKAVVWTDVFQAGIILLGLLTIVIKSTIEVGGVLEVWNINKRWNRVTPPNFSFDPTIRLTFWSVCVMNSFLWINIAGSQASVQRFVSLPSLRNAQLSTLLILPGFLLSGMLTCASGVVAFAYYAKKGCDPVSSGTISGPNQILPFFVMDVLNIPGLPGLFIASLFSASLSSLSSGYSGMGAVMWQNVLRRKWGHLPSKSQANITKLCTFIFGVLGIISAFLMMGIGGTLIQITYSVLGVTGGPLMGIVFVGAIISKAGGKLTMAAAITSITFSVWVGLGSSKNKIRDPPLPGPTYNCSIPESLEIHVNNTNFTFMSNEYPDVYFGSAVDFNISTTVESDHHKKRSISGLNKLYSLSYFYYPFLGLAMVFVLSLVGSLFSCCIPSVKTQKKLLFPCMRRHFGVPDEEDNLEASPGLMSTKREDFETKNQRDGEESDVWIPREDFNKTTITCEIKNGTNSYQ